MDDLDLGNEINEILGLPPNKDSAAEEEIGEERLGSSSITASFGATLILGTLVFVLLVLTIALVIYIG